MTPKLQIAELPRTKKGQAMQVLLYAPLGCWLDGYDGCQLQV